MPTHPDAYVGLTRLYLSQHAPDAGEGRDIDDPVMSAWLASNLQDGARVLDAGCGLGFDVLALHHGLPAQGTGRRFEVYGADYSADMLLAAQRAGAAVGIPADRYRRAAFDELGDATAWRASMDAVTVNYAIYTQPEEDCDYDAYLAASLRGLASVLKPAGVLALNLRDWDALKQADAAGAVHAHSNVHGMSTLHCRYNWSFGAGRVHQTTLSMWEDNGPSRATDIWFAERSPTEMGKALANAGLRVNVQGRHGDGVNAFFTLIARKESD